MPLFTSQVWFCNACGKEHFSVPFNGYGIKYKTCGKECHDLMMLRDSKAILGHPSGEVSFGILLDG